MALSSILRFPLYIMLLVAALPALAQPNTYWVQFADKDTAGYQPERHLTAACLDNRRRLGLPLRQYSDIPVKARYVKDVQRLGKLVCTSKWLNGAAVEANETQLTSLRQLPFVKAVLPMHQLYAMSWHNYPRAKVDTSLTITLRQIKAESFIKNNVNGEGVRVGVLDAGFRSATDNKLLTRYFAEKRVVRVRNVHHQNEDSAGVIAGTSGHGTHVWQLVGGYDPNSGEMQGLATNATYYLCRSEYDAREERMEEVHYIRGLEWFDSLGVRLVNASLGYSLKFTQARESHKTTDMDGKTTLVSQGAQMAVTQKGMVLVNSAGNEGNEEQWQGLISAPADAPGVISVGANWPNGTRISYSGKGPDYLPYAKPDVACFSLSGTSYSSPVVAGLLAGLLQLRPDLSPAQVQHLLHKSSSLYPVANNWVGYGTPSAEKLLQLAYDTSLTFNQVVRLTAKGDNWTMPAIKEPEKAKRQATRPGASAPAPAPQLTEEKVAGLLVFHKKSPLLVVENEYVKNEGKAIKIKRGKNARLTTVQAGNTLYEIEWVD